jgi:hypothetical protein
MCASAARHSLRVSFDAAVARPFGFGLAARAADGDRLRREPGERDVFAAIDAGAIDALGQAPLRQHDVVQACGVDFEFGVARFLDAFGFGVVGIAVDLVGARRHAEFERRAGRLQVAQGRPFHGVEPLRQRAQVVGGQVVHGICRS